MNEPQPISWSFLCPDAPDTPDRATVTTETPCWIMHLDTAKETTRGRDVTDVLFAAAWAL